MLPSHHTNLCYTMGCFNCDRYCDEYTIRGCTWTTWKFLLLLFLFLYLVLICCLIFFGEPPLAGYTIPFNVWFLLCDISSLHLWNIYKIKYNITQCQRRPLAVGCVGSWLWRTSDSSKTGTQWQCWAWSAGSHHDAPTTARPHLQVTLPSVVLTIVTLVQDI